MRNLKILPFAISILCLSIHSAYAEISKTFKTKLATVKVTQMISDLPSPWGMEMLPDGKLLITLRDGEMIIADPENPNTKQTVSGVPKVWARGQGGLLDVAIDPDFTTNQTIYFTFSDASSGRGTGTSLASATLDLSSKPTLRNVKTLFAMKKTTNSSFHFGSRIVLDREGHIYFTIGDRGDDVRAQDPKDAAGSVIRINKDGSVPQTNPFADGKDALPQIWSIGHRNAQGAALHPETGEFWSLSHGAQGGDEINKPEAGKNYGWPTISYGREYSGAKIGVGTQAEGMEQPLYYWDPSIAPSGLDFYTGDAIPEWKGNLFAGALKFRLLSRLEMDGDKIIGEEQLFEDEFGRIREVRAFADGALWFMTDADDGAIYRITSAK